MLSRGRVGLTVIAVLSLSSLALADSAPVSTMFVRSSSGAPVAAQVSTSHLSTSPATAALMGAGSFQQPGVPVSRQMTLGSDRTATTHFTARSDVSGTISHKNGEWAVYRPGPVPSPMATPEPGSLMLLSTGLLGIAGLVRRRMQRSPA